MSDLSNQKPEPLKTHLIVDTDKSFSGARDRQVQDLDGRPVYWIHATSGYSFTKSLTVTVRNTPSAPALAASKLSALGWGGLVTMLGDPDAPGASNHKPWAKVHTLQFFKYNFSFEHSGITYVWKNTHKSEYGASKWSSKDFKLVTGPGGKAPEGQLLALLVWDLGTWKMRSMDPKAGKLEIFEELGEELEALAVAAVLGQIARIKQAETAAVVS